MSLIHSHQWTLGPRTSSALREPEGHGDGGRAFSPGLIVSWADPWGGHPSPCATQEGLVGQWAGRRDGGDRKGRLASPF